VRVVDGDTVELVVDLGFKVSQRLTIRMISINAPEMKTEPGKLSRAHLELLLGGPGELYLKSQKDKADKYGGRYLGVLYKGGRALNAQMIADGFAEPYSGQGPTP
jgi:micrococcal nuclease